MSSTDTLPQSSPVTLTLSTGDTITIEPFTALQVLEDGRLMDAMAAMEAKVEASREAHIQLYRDKVIEAGFTLEQAAEMPDEEAAKLGFVVGSPGRMELMALCRPELASMVYAAVKRDSSYFATLGVDDLMALIGAVFQANANRYAKKLAALGVSATLMQGLGATAA